jgi:hypothetical protein
LTDLDKRILFGKLKQNGHEIHLLFTIFQDGGKVQDGQHFSFCSKSFNIRSMSMGKCYLETPCKCLSKKNIDDIIFKMAVIFKMAALIFKLLYFRDFCIFLTKFQQVTAFWKRIDIAFYGKILKK